MPNCRGGGAISEGLEKFGFSFEWGHNKVQIVVLRQLIKKNKLIVLFWTKIVKWGDHNR